MQERDGTSLEGLTAGSQSIARNWTHIHMREGQKVCVWLEEREPGEVARLDYEGRAHRKLRLPRLNS